MDFDTLYRDVLARPDDDTPRRVLADFLADEGDPLGDLIRVQCDLAEKGHRAARALRVIEADLLQEHGGAWHARFAPWATEVAFQRGFPALAWTTVGWLDREGKKAAPLPNLNLVIELEPTDDGARLLGLPVFESVNSLELSRGLLVHNRFRPTLDRFWPAIAQARRLTGLHLDGVSTPNDLRGLLGLARFDDLTELSLRALTLSTPYGEFDHAAVGPLFERLERSPSLRLLDLTGGRLNAVSGGLARLLRNGPLTRLIVDYCNLDAGNLGTVALAAAEREVSVVSISNNPGLGGPWKTHDMLAGAVRQDPEDQQATVTRGPPQRPALGRIGPWQLDDLVGHRTGTTRYLVGSAGQPALLTHLAASASTFGPPADELSTQREMLERAARGLVGLAHPNLIKWLDFGLYGTGSFVVHELTDSRSLREVVEGLRARHETMTVPQAAGIALDVCRALIALHNAGLTHGAVNETTIFLTASGSARLLPLGLDTPVFYGSGSHRFLSPEQALPPVQAGLWPADQALYDGRSDLFQLGVVLHLMLSGKHPFLRRTEFATLNAITGREVDAVPELPGSVPPPIRELITTLLAVDRAARPPNAEAVLMELALRARLSIAPTPEPAPPADVDWLQRAWELARLLTLWGPPLDRHD